jgi:hypothetical protein
MMVMSIDTFIYVLFSARRGVLHLADLIAPRLCPGAVKHGGLRPPIGGQLRWIFCPRAEPRGGLGETFRHIENSSILDFKTYKCRSVL